MFNLFNCSFQKEINHASLSETKHCVTPRGPQDPSSSAQSHQTASELHGVGGGGRPADSSTPPACAALHLRRAPHRQTRAEADPACVERTEDWIWLLPQKELPLLG